MHISKSYSTTRLLTKQEPEIIKKLEAGNIHALIANMSKHINGVLSKASNALCANLVTRHTMH